ncbi:right-handed parallel beta-helix repeat-containing protein [Rhabdothermincola sp.]|uniref:right-handed parallel beta-helix repeat-containing protein n=1 Tax=Rhabdothermincola sp. TaxID=2820405 RepID=UPI002FE1AE2D
MGIWRRAIALTAAMVGVTCWLVPAAPAGADAIFTVDSNGDQGDGNPGDGQCSVAPDGSGPCTLRAAVEEANASGGSTSVTVPAMTIDLGDALIVQDGVTLTISGAGAGLTVLDGPSRDTLLFVNGGANVTVRGLTLTGSSDSGPAVLIYGTLLLDQVEVVGNENIDSDGTVVVASIMTDEGPFYGELTVRRSTIADNSVEGDGGAIYAPYEGVVIRVENSTITGNRAGGPGGAIYAAEGTLELSFVTIAGNSSSRAGDGLYLEDNLTFRVTGSILQGDDQACIYDGDVDTVSGGGNVVADTSCALGATNDREGADPQLAPLADNGGPTRTMAIPAGSPAVDNALARGCPATDQRGVSRPQGAACDSGAYELEVAPPPTSTTTTVPGGAAEQAAQAQPRYAG